jgi:hypothetical protein
VAKRSAAADASGLPNAEFAKRFYSMVAWHEDLYAEGPPLEVFKAHIRGAGLAHFEMLLALAGKREDLIKERQMENVFNRERGRGGTLIFVHDQGAAWDVITLGVYRTGALRGTENIRRRQLAAAKQAGFPALRTGPYMRTLISTHRYAGPILPMGLRRSRADPLA